MDREQKNSAFVAFFPGIASFFGGILLYPLNTVSVRMSSEKALSKTFMSQTLAYCKSDGLTGLYKGWTSTIPNSFLATFLFFYIYENLNSVAKAYSEREWKNLKLKETYDFLFPFVTSGIAQFVPLSYVIPVDTIRTRIQACDPNFDYKGILDGARKIQQKEGFRRIYNVSSGFIASFCLYASVQFGTYEYGKKLYIKATEKQDLNVLESTIGAVIASFSASLAINPIELIIVRHQTVETTKGLTLRDVFEDIMRKEGIRGLYKGFSARAVYYCALTLLDLPIYEYFRKQYGVNL